MLILLKLGCPLTLATSSNSSTTTGSTINEGIPASSPMDLAISPPRLDACSPMVLVFRSSTNVSLTAYVPPSMGFKRPPLPTAESSDWRAILFSFSAWIIKSFLNSNCSATLENFASSSFECLRVVSNTGLSSSKTAILVDVLPGLMINCLILFSL